MSEKFCKDCRYSGSWHCDNPKLLETPNVVSGKPHDTLPMIACRNAPWLCGPEGKWFEPKAPDPGEGWRMLNAGELKEQGDEIYHGQGLWVPITSEHFGWPVSDEIVRRRITPELERCPEGHEAILSWWYGGFRVHCDLGESYQWITPQYKTKDEAVSAWNSVMRSYREAREKAGETMRRKVE